MLEKDFATSLKVVLALDSASLSASANGDAIDTNGFFSLTYVIQTAAVTTADADNRFTMTPQDSPDDGSGSPTGVWTNVAADFLIGALPLINDEDADDDKVFKIGVISKERHQRIVAVETGTAVAVIGAVAILTDAKERPTVDQFT